MEVDHDPVAVRLRRGLALAAPPGGEILVELVELAGRGGEALRLGALAGAGRFALEMRVVLGQPQQRGRGELGLLGDSGWPYDRGAGGGRLEADAVEPRERRDEDRRLVQELCARRPVAQ